MSNWMIKAYEVLKVLEEYFKRKMKEGPVIQMDETTLQVMNEPGREDTQLSYMWLARGGPPETPLVIYKYHENRQSQHAKDFLEGYSGYLQTDGYQGYDSALKENDSIIHVGCLAHARRKLTDATKATTKKGGSAHLALSMIQKIYRVESALREQDLSQESFLEERKKQAGPLLENFKTWLDKKSLTVRPNSKTGEACPR